MGRWCWGRLDGLTVSKVGHVGLVVELLTSRQVWRLRQSVSQSRPRAQIIPDLRGRTARRPQRGSSRSTMSTGYSSARYGGRRWGDDDFGDGDEEEELQDGLVTDAQQEWASKDAVIFAIDCAPAMLVSQPAGKTECAPAVQATACASAFLKHKIIASETDLVSVVYYNTEKTKNTFSSAEHVYVIQELDVPDAQRIKQLEAIAVDKDASRFRTDYGTVTNGAGLADVLFLCNLMFSANAQRVGSKRIFLITNEDDPDSGDMAKRTAARTRAQDITDLGIQIELFGLEKPGVEFNLENFYADALSRDENEEGLSGATKLENLAVKIRRKEVKKRSQFRVPFKLTDDVVIGVRGYTVVMAAQKPQHKYISLDGETAVEVMASTTWISDDAAQQQLIPADMQNYFIYGGSRVMFSAEELLEIKNFGPPGLTLLGTKPQSAVKMQHNLKHPYFIYPDESEYSGSTTVFAALLKVLAEEEKCAIVRFIPRKNTAPRFGALFPQEEVRDELGQTRPPGFHVVPLPFSEDIRSRPYDDLETDLNESHVAAAEAIVGKIVIKGGFQPENFENPALKLHYANLQAIALEQPIVDQDGIVDKTLPLTSVIVKATGELIKKFNEAVYGDDYLPPADGVVKAPPKRKALSQAANPKSAVAKRDAGEIDVEKLSRDGKLNSLTVAQLKEYIEGKGVKPRGKKADLVEQIEQLLS